LHPKTTKQKKEKKGAQVSLLLRLDDGTIGTQKKQIKRTKNKKQGMQAPPMLKFRDDIHLHQKQQNKKIKRRGVEAPHLSIFSDGP
jgi:hypothetical protein